MVRTSVHDTIGCTSCDLLLNKCRETWNLFVTWINSFSDQCHFSLMLKTLDSSLSNCSCVVRRSRRITSSSARTVSPSETRPLLMTSSAKKKNRNFKNCGYRSMVQCWTLKLPEDTRCTQQSLRSEHELHLSS